jgi:hypothetical protein
MAELAPSLCFSTALWRCPTADKVVSHANTSYSYALFELDKNISIVYKKQQWYKLHQSIQTPPSYIPAVIPMSLELVFNKPHPSILLHFQDSNTQKVAILLLQEVKCYIRHAQLQIPRRTTTAHKSICSG